MEAYIVNHWLREEYGGDLPPFEVNEDTIRVLKQIFDRYKSSEAGLSIIQEEIKEKNAEYQAETEQVREILKSLYFSQDALPDRVNELISSIANLAVVLKSRDTSLANMTLLLTSHLIYVKDSDLDEVLPVDKINLSILSKIAAVEEAMSELKGKTDVVKESSERERESRPSKESDMIFLQKKRQEYVDTRREFEQKLSESGFREEVSHTNVATFRKEVGKLNSQLSELRKRKQYYKCLPLNSTLAKVKLEEAKLELERLNQEIMTKLNLSD